jgi:membrane associated rhomboid family serine protease
MIFPILSGLYSVLRAPVTWTIFFLNLLVFFVTFQASEKYQTDIESFLRDRAFSETQGLVFARFVQNNASRYPAGIQSMADGVLSSADTSRRRVMGGMALRDSYFLSEAMNLKWQGDQVAFSWWQKKFQDLMELRDVHPSYGLGLTFQEAGVLRWLTYQFTHGGVSHFVGNMLFFLIFAGALELTIGSLGVLSIYLVAGMFSALFFLFMNEASAIPLIGASGAVSGLMAFFCFYFGRQNVRYLFFLMIPKRGFAGFIYLPAWLILILWFVSDLAGFMATPQELGGIAYSAHLGGELAGAVMALTLIVLRKIQKKPLYPEKLPFDTQPVLTRYV